MRTFLIGWAVAFCLVAFVATGVGWMVGSAPPPPPPTPARGALNDGFEEPAAPFTEADGIEIVARRLAPTGGIEQVRQDLKESATVTYHSARHWRICLDTACWVAHGPGRYAEPDNDAARQREARPAAPSR